ncbi:MAG TPA: M56 family metallopeptidase [Caulobacteraceae bacterium]|nr:M56 family metallopeptidase [Caulobacteraceae bacterium]
MPAVLNHLWQSTLFGCAVALVALILRKSGAGLRFQLWLAASVKFLLPFALLSTIGALFAPVLDPGPGLRTIGEAADRFPEFLNSGPVVGKDMTPIFDPAPWLLAVWAAGAIAILGVRFFRWRRLRSILRASRPLPSAGPLPVRASPSVLEPGLFGFFKSVVLLPESLPQTLRSDEIEAILAHETAHFQRRDNLWAAIHMLVEGLFWFHPMVWWIGRRLIADRERACDDAVVQCGHRRAVYARAILISCRTYLRSSLACVSGVSGAGLAGRIEAIMTSPAPGRATTAQMAVLLAAGALAIATPLLTGALGATAANGPGGGWASLFDSGPTPAQVAHDLAAQERPRIPAPFAPARFDAYVGDYELGPYAIQSISRRGDRFFAQLTGQNAVELYPEGGAEFFMKAVPAQISFVAGADGRTTALVQHQGGINLRMRRLSPAAAADLRARLSRRIAENRPSPGTEAYVRRWAAAAAAGRLDDSQMAHALARAAKEQWPQTRVTFRTLGPLKDVRFLRVSPQGADLYEADFQNRRLFVRVEPLVRGKEIAHFWRFMSPAEGSGA